MTQSLSQTAQNAYDLGISLLLSLTIVPHQLCTALSLIGESFLSGCHSVGEFTKDTVYLLFWTPYHTLVFLSHILVELIKIPPKVASKIPASAYIGLFVVAVIYLIYCRLSFRRFFTSVFNFVKGAFGLVHILIQFVTPRIFGRSNSVVNNNVGDSGLDLKGMCVACQENPVQYIANPCSHVSLCRECVHRLVKVDNRCPMCRNVVDTFSRVYIA